MNMALACTVFDWFARVTHRQTDRRNWDGIYALPRVKSFWNVWRQNLIIWARLTSVVLQRCFQQIWLFIEWMDRAYIQYSVWTLLSRSLITQLLVIRLFKHVLSVWPNRGPRKGDNKNQSYRKQRNIFALCLCGGIFKIFWGQPPF